MIGKLGTGWQTATADLALILFLVTAQATLSEPKTPPPVSREEPSPPAPFMLEGSGSAIFRPGNGVDLSTWLAETLTDDRQSVTAIVRFAPGTRAKALEAADAVLAQIEDRGASPRLIVEPASASETLVVIGYEAAALQERTRERPAGTVLAE